VTQADSRLLDRYFDVMSHTRALPGNLRFYVDYLFHGVELADRTVLDVGAGDGTLSFYAACKGASKVVSLEPEAAGSSAGMNAAFERTAALLDQTRVELVPQRLQDYEPSNASFDVLLLHASINHLDEDACNRLHRDLEAQTVYVGLFRKLAASAKPGSKLIVVDCARRNLYADLGVTNPFARTIEWQKHQSPELWSQLLARTGFTTPVIRWNSFNSLRSFGRLLFGNRIAAYCLTSVFCLTMARTQPRSASMAS